MQEGYSPHANGGPPVARLSPPRLSPGTVPLHHSTYTILTVKYFIYEVQRNTVQYVDAGEGNKMVEKTRSSSSGKWRMSPGGY